MVEQIRRGLRGMVDALGWLLGWFGEGTEKRRVDGPTTPVGTTSGDGAAAGQSGARMLGGSLDSERRSCEATSVVLKP